MCYQYDELCVCVFNFHCLEFLCACLIGQVRMDALGLLCESHRSTEVLSSREMDLIRHFLLPNLNSQSAGVRQQTVSLMKKVGRRPGILFWRVEMVLDGFNFLNELCCALFHSCFAE